MTALAVVASAIPGQAAVSPGLTIVSGNGQVVWEQFRTAVPLVIQARDTAGNPVPNLPITWAVTQGQGTLSASDAKTDANGVATTYFVGTGLPAGNSFLSQTITASSTLGSVNMVITTVISRLPNGGSGSMPLVQVLSPPMDNPVLSGKAGDTIAKGFQVQVVALSGPQQGMLIPNVGITLVDANDPTNPPPAVCAGSPLSDAQGIASCDIVLTGAPGTYRISAWVGGFVYTPAASLTITPAVACTYSLSPSSASVPAAGINGTIAVTAPAGCGWTASSNTSWLTITSGGTGSGNGSVTYSVGPNSSVARTAALTIGGQTFTVNQAAPASGGNLTFTSSASLPTAVAGASYSVTLTASGGKQPYTFGAATTLPAGLVLNPTTGVLSGVVNQTGSYSFVLSLTDSAGVSVSQNFGLNVVTSSSGASPAITNTSFVNGTVGTPYSQLLTSVGGCTSPFSPPPVFSLLSGTLPPGLSIQNQEQSRTSFISGTPAANGAYVFTLQVTDSCGRTGTGTFSITVGTGGSGGAVAASPTQLQFTQQVGTNTPTTQVLTVTGSGVFLAQAQMNEGASMNWLSVSPGSATAPTAVTVSASASSLPPGTYTGVIQLIPSGAIVAVTVPVSLRVLPPPKLESLPTSLFYLYQQGSAPSTTQTLTISSTGVALSFTASATTESGGSWLFVSPATSTTPGVLTVAVNPLGLTSGTYKGSVTLTPSAAGVPAVTVPVTLSITQTAPFVTSVVNGASFLPGPISPGEVVTLYGTNMGPADLVGLRFNEQGLVDTTVSDTRVFFDGTAAPILYTKAGQVSVIVPYTIAGRVSTKVEVQYRGVKSTALEIRVADSAPGIFVTTDGQAAALNQNGVPNTTQNGADPGSVIALYATGEGQTDPAGVDGRVTGSTLAKPLQAVTAQVGGIDAEVQYAGAAPGMPAGVMQVNVRVPEGVPHGAAAPVVISVGRVTSQSGVTVYVK